MRDLILLVVIPMVLIAVCLATGYGILNILKKRQNFSRILIVGYVFCTTVFQIIAMPFMLFQMEFAPLFYGYIVILLLICVYAFYIFFIKETGINVIKKEFSNAMHEKTKTIAWCLVLAGVAGQVLYVVAKQHTDIDDSYYIAMVNTIIETGRIHSIDPASGMSQFGFSSQYKLVGYEVLLSVIARFFNVNAAYLSHTILPVFLVPLHYLIISNIAKMLDKKSAPYFVLLYEITNIYSGYSGYSQGAFLLYRIWQGKAVMINVCVPILILAFLWLYDSKRKIGKSTIVYITGVLISGLHTTTVAVYLIPIAYFGLVASYLLMHKNWLNTIKLCLPIVFIMPYVVLKLCVLRFDAAQSAMDTIESVTSDADSLSYIYELIDKYMAGNTWLLALVVVACVYICLYGGRKAKGVIVFPAFVLMVTFCNPFLMTFVAQNVTGSPVYWRVFWLLEFPLILVSAIVLLVKRTKIEDIYGIIPAIGVVIIAFSGSYIFTESGFVDRENRYKLDGRSVAISDMVLADSNKRDDEVILLLPEDLSYSVREYTGEISLLINRYTSSLYLNDGKENDYDRLNELTQMLWGGEKKWDSDELSRDLLYFNVDYLVLYSQYEEKVQLPDSLTEIGVCNEFTIYRVENL